MSWLRSDISWIDVTVIAVYLVASLCIGVLGSKLLGLSNGKEDDYYLAGRKMPGWLNGLSNAATALNSDVAPLYCGVAVVAGLSGAWFYLSRFGFGMLIVSLLFAVKWRQMRVKTGPEFFTLRYGGTGSKAARVYSSIYSVLLGMIPWIGAGMVGMHKVAAPIFGYESIWVTIGVILPLLTIYVWSSGLAGVLITDGLQGIIIIVGNLVLVISVLVAFGGPTGMGEALKNAYNGKDKTHLTALANANVSFYHTEPDADGNFVQVVVYPEERSGYFGNSRKAETFANPVMYEMSKGVSPAEALKEATVIDVGHGYKLMEYSASKDNYIAKIKLPNNKEKNSEPLTLVDNQVKVLLPIPASNSLHGTAVTAAALPKVDEQTAWNLNGIQEFSEVATTGTSLSSSLPQPGMRIVSPVGVILWMVILLVGVGGGVGSDGQRYFSCKNNYEAAKVGLWGNVALFGMLLLLMLPVLGMLARYPELHFVDSSGDRENIYGRMLVEFLPKGFIGVTVAAMLSSVMSTVSTHLNYGSQTLLNDVYRPLFGDPGKGKSVFIGQLLMLIIVALSIIVTVNADSLIGITMVVIGVLGSAASYGWGQWWWWRTNIKSWTISIFAGPLLYGVFQFLLPSLEWWRNFQAAAPENSQIVQAIMAMLLGTVCWVIAALVTEPENMDTLKEFYLRARPHGCWGPVKQALIAEGRLSEDEVKTTILPGFVTAIVGFIMMAAGTMVCTTLFVGQYKMMTIYIVITLISGYAFKRMFHWHLHRMGADVDCYVQVED